MKTKNSILKSLRLVCLLAMVSVLQMSYAMPDENDPLDFDYPQTVVKAAQTDIDKSLRAGNGEQLVDALIRYSIGKGSISAESMPSIVSKIDSVLALEKRPEYRALLLHLKAKVFKSYRETYGTARRVNPIDEAPADDVTEWDNAQLTSKIEECIAASVADADALKLPIGNFESIIKGDDRGKMYVPTLYDFLLMKGIEFVNNDSIAGSMYGRWVEAEKDNTLPYIFSSLRKIDHEGYVSAKDRMRLYNETGRTEDGGLALAGVSNSDYYYDLKDYVRRFPNSFYTPEIKNAISDIESERVQVYYQDYVSSTDSIKLEVKTKNVAEYRIQLYRVPDRYLDESRIPVKDLKLVATLTDKLTDVKVPFTQERKLAFAPQPYGIYIILPEFDHDNKKQAIVNTSNYKMFRVHDLMLFTVSELDQPVKIFAVDAKSGKPLQGVTLTSEDHTGVTNSEGYLEVPKDSRYDFYRATFNGDKYAPSVSPYDVNASQDFSVKVKMFTDLAIYRPGETVNFAGILYRTGYDSRTVVPGEQVRVIFSDTNRKGIDTTIVRADEYGRFEGKFVVPTDRMNGTFRMNASLYQDKDIVYLGNQYVEVSEYKTPTFFVNFDAARFSFTRRQPVTIKGKVETYSGMPLANTEVKLSLIKNSWYWSWWRYSSNGDAKHINDTTITTNAAGEFVIDYRANMFEENQTESDYYIHHVYRVDASCVDATGETQTASVNFIIGSNHELKFTASEIEQINDKPITLPLIYETTDEVETVVRVAYEVKKDRESPVLKSGVFSSDKPVVDLTDLPSGKYYISARIADAADSQSTSMNVILYRQTDKQAPIADAYLWVPQSGRSVDKKNVAHITIGTSVPKAHIYYVARSRTKILKEGWITYSPGIHDFTIQIPNAPEEFVSVNFVSAYGRAFATKSVTLYSEANQERLDIKVESFRDKLMPGKPERFAFRLQGKDNTWRRGAMLLEMMDKAVNDVSDNSWSFSPSFQSLSLYYISASTPSGSSSESISWKNSSLTVGRYSLPQLNFYGQDIFDYMYAGNMRQKMLKSSAMVGGSAPMAVYATAVQENYMAYDSAPAEMERASEAKSEEAKEKLGNVAVRETDVKTALWMPTLVADDKGNVSVEFDAPNFNTTWILQAIAFTKDLYTAKLAREVLTQKPLMVKSSLPRFVRQGDVVTLKANVQNATENATAYDAVIELFDPKTGQVFTSKNFNGQLGSKGTDPVGIEWTVPDTIPFLGFRIKAANDVYGDGEQVMLPVLPSISPVIETKPFYIDAAEPHFSLTLPEFKSDARVTLEYCDNPVWYCVLALPTIFDGNYNIATSLAHNLFAEVLAQGLAKMQPNIKEAVTYWKQNEQDSVLVSMLAKNQDLKIGTLLASPWINEADRQTLRMSQLDELFDEAKMAVVHKKIVEGLRYLQNSDGGWPWYKYPGARSSLWSTETVLELIGELQHLGYITDDADINNLVKKAMSYYDAEYLRILRERQKDGRKDYSGFESYVYVRTLFPQLKPGKSNAELIEKALKAMTKDWKGTSIGNKAFYAMSLARNGYTKDAKSIVESIRQYALVKPELGMYWDNLATNGWYFQNKVAVTAVVLEAFNEIDPRQDEIDQIRKWMLLMKQTNDWGSSSLAADAVYALLATGSKWLERNGTPRVSLNGEQLTFDKMAEYLGYTRRSIPATSLGTITIERNGNSPAWGAIYNQYKAEMTQVEQYSITEMSVTKEFYRYAQDGSLHPVTEFHVGDKIQVRTVIKNNKDLEYVTLVDERGACFEPVDRFSGYRLDERSYFYLETKDAQTNAFFDKLYKGTHVVVYDLYVTAEGEYNVGIATAQCQYAPQISAHSAGRMVTVK